MIEIEASWLEKAFKKAHAKIEYSIIYHHSPSQHQSLNLKPTMPSPAVLLLINRVHPHGIQWTTYVYVVIVILTPIIQ